MKPLLLVVLAMALLSAAPASRKFTGKITDDMCARADHSKMLMGSDDRECTIACVHSHGAQYVLFDGNKTYALSDQNLGEKFAGKKVAVTGTLDAKGTLHVASMTAAK